MTREALSRDTQKQDFFDNPKNIRWMLRGFYVVCGLLLIADFFVHRHIYVYFERLPAFYPLYGFVACLLLVFVGKILRSAVKRDEAYYDKAESGAGETHKDVREAE